MSSELVAIERAIRRVGEWGRVGGALEHWAAMISDALTHMKGFSSVAKGAEVYLRGKNDPVGRLVVEIAEWVVRDEEKRLNNEQVPAWPQG